LVSDAAGSVDLDVIGRLADFLQLTLESRKRGTSSLTTPRDFPATIGNRKEQHFNPKRKKEKVKNRSRLIQEQGGDTGE
jgi:hypothetical protein